MPQHRSWVRGNCVLIVDDVPNYCMKGPDVLEYQNYDWNKRAFYNLVRSQARYGDILHICSHLGSGWYRARNLNTDKIITIRTGPYMAPRGKAPYISDKPLGCPQWPSRGSKSNVPVEEERVVRYLEDDRFVNVTYYLPPRHVSEEKSDSVSSSESLGERRGFKKLECEIDKPEFPVEHVVKVDDSLDDKISKELKEARILLAKQGETISELSQQLEQTRQNERKNFVAWESAEWKIKELVETLKLEQNKVAILQKWRNKILEPTLPEAWELVNHDSQPDFSDS